MAAKPGEISKAFWFWVLANLLGFTALAAGAFILAGLIQVPGVAPTVLAISLPISIMQWIALRRITPLSAWWIITVPIGLFLAVNFFRAVPAWLPDLGYDESTAVLTALYLVMGFAIGLPQWALIRRHYSGASIWLLGSSAGTAGGLWLVLTTGLLNQSEIVSYTLIILVYAAVTGLALTRLLARPGQSPAEVSNITLPLAAE